MSIATATDRNNFDVDFCEFRGWAAISSRWGDRQGTEFRAEAVYDGSLASVLRGFFPRACQDSVTAGYVRQDIPDEPRNRRPSRSLL
jgi:hypothetical protein